MKYFYLYKITNIIDQKVYIGQSVNPKNRWGRHKCDARLKKSKSHLSSALRRYGFDNFLFEIIVQARSLEDIDDLEIACIQQYQSSNKEHGYNISLGGNGKRMVSEETKKKISLFRTGKKASRETIKRMSQSMAGKNKGIKNGMFGTPSEHTTCAKLTISQAYEIRKEYASGSTFSTKLAKKYGVSKKSILNILHNKTYV